MITGMPINMPAVSFGESEDRAITLLPSGGILVLDTNVSAELAAEGLARDVVRAVQDARKEAGLEVSDRIRLTLRADDASVAAIGAHRELIAGETLAVEFEVTGGLAVPADAETSADTYGALEIDVEVVA